MTPSKEFLVSSHTAILGRTEDRGQRGGGAGRGGPRLFGECAAFVRDGARSRGAEEEVARGQGRQRERGDTGQAHMTPHDTIKRQATSALEGTLCSMHTAKTATHTGTDARIIWCGRSRSRA